MKDRYFIKLCLRALVQGKLTMDETIDRILDYQDKCISFHFRSFEWGMAVGSIILFIMLQVMGKLK